MSHVYFIQSELGGPVKVGVAVDPGRRLAALQVSNPFTLRLHAAVPGDRALEAAIHATLGDFRIRGEWFSASEEVERERVRLVRARGSAWDRKIAIGQRSPRSIERLIAIAREDEAHRQLQIERRRSFDRVASIRAGGLPFGCYVAADGVVRSRLPEERGLAAGRVAACRRCGSLFRKGAPYAEHFRQCAA